MIFNLIDFHCVPTTISARKNDKRFRLHIAHIIDSFWVRIPKRIKTERIGKLNVIAESSKTARQYFWEIDGIASAGLRVPDVAKIFKADQSEAVRRVKKYLRAGIRIAAAHDKLFARHLELWNELVATADQEYDHYFPNIARSHSSRKWRCEAVWRITPAKYYYDVVIRETKSGNMVERHRIKTTECNFPYYSGIGFSKLLWKGTTVVGLTKEGKIAFRIKTNLPSD